MTYISSDIELSEPISNFFRSSIPLFFPTMGNPALMKERKHANKVITALARKNLTFVHMVWKKKMAFDLDIYRQRKLATAAVSGIIPSSSACPSSAADLVTNLVR